MQTALQVLLQPTCSILMGRTCHRKALLDGVDKVPALTNRVITGGRLNVAKALAKLLGKPEPAALPELASEDENTCYGWS